MTFPAKSIVMLCTAERGGMSQVVHSLQQAGLFDRYRIRLLTTHDRINMLGRLWLFLTSFVKFANLLRRREVSAVHAHMAMRGSTWRKALYILLAQRLGIPTFIHLHGSQFETFFGREIGPVRQRVIRVVFENSAAVFALSEHWRHYICCIAPRARVHVVPNFVDADTLAREIKASGATRTDDVILFLGEVGRRKGAFDLVLAMPDVIAAFPSARVIIAGKGELGALRRLATEHSIQDHVITPGWISGTAKHRLLGEAAIYVLPSHNEGLPVSILEAMGAGLPVVTTPVGGIPDAITNGQEGLLVPPGCPRQLADALIQLLGDPSLRDAMGERARMRVATEFCTKRALSTIEAVYDEHELRQVQ